MEKEGVREGADKNQQDPTSSRIYPDLQEIQMEVHPEAATNDGPFNRRRRCTDIPCLLLFMVFWVGMGYVSFVALQFGQPERLIYGMDSFGNICGRKNTKINGAVNSGLDLTEKPFLFTFDPLKQASRLPTIQVCIASCPNDTLLTSSQFEEYEICKYDLPFEDYAVAMLQAKDCPAPGVPSSIPILNRCIPTTALDTATLVIQTQWIEDAFADLQTSWKEILYLCAIAVGLSLVVLILLRFFAGILIWLMIISFFTGSVGGTGYLWYKWYLANEELQTIPIDVQLEMDQQNVKTLQIYAAAASAVTGILVLILLVMCKRIALAVALFKEAGKALASSPLLLVQPVWTFFFLGIIFGGCGYVFLYLLTAGEPQVDEEDGTVTFVDNEHTLYMQMYYVLGILWGSQFIIACEQFVIASAVSSWYFTRDKKKFGVPILKGVTRLARYHLGSIAFGSLLIAIVMFARIVLGYIQSKLKNSTSEPVKYILKCLQCLLWLFEKILKFINRNAYIEMAIYGYSFCKSARKAFTVIVNNALRMVAINSVGDFLLFLGKIAVAASVVIIGMEFFQNNPEVNYYAVPIAVAAVFALIVSHVFLSVYEMAIDTLFICFCEDCDQNDGITRPYFMSRNLLSFVDNSREVEQAQKREAWSS